jgi:Ni/Fe-hydrogenase subunit HybB-like protein
MNVFVRWTLALVVVVGLAIDAYTHLDLAHEFSFNSTGTVNEGVLFQVEAVLAIVSALLIVYRQNALTATVALLVAGGGAIALVVYRYVDIGKIGPVPDMYEPIWFDEKVVSLIGELVAAAGALAMLVAILFSRHASQRHTVAA